MKTLFKKIAFALAFAPVILNAQADLVIGLNYSYDPPANCNNQINNISVDICNNGNSAASAFAVGIYLYNPSTQQHWVLDQTTLNSLSGNACVTINNWNIDMNNYPSLPAPGNNYRIGVWADTADVISESNETNNTALLSGNIQVCAPTGIRSNKKADVDFLLLPNPASSSLKLNFSSGTDELITVSLENLNGMAVKNIYSGKWFKNGQSLETSLEDISSGVYFVRVETGNFRTIKKLVVTK